MTINFDINILQINSNVIGVQSVAKGVQNTGSSNMEIILLFICWKHVQKYLKFDI